SDRPARKAVAWPRRASPTATLKGDPPGRASRVKPLPLSAETNMSNSASPATRIMSRCPQSCRLLEQHLAVARKRGQQRHPRPTHGARIAADGARGELHRRQPLAVEAGHLRRGAAEDALAHLGGKGAVDDRGLEIDDGDRGDHRLGKALRGLLDPMVEMT